MKTKDLPSNHPKKDVRRPEVRAAGYNRNYGIICRFYDQRGGVQSWSSGLVGYQEHKSILRRVLSKPRLIDATVFTRIGNMLTEDYFEGPSYLAWRDNTI